MNVAIVVGAKYRDLDSIRRYVNRMKTSTGLLIMSPSTKGENLAAMAARRRGMSVQYVEHPSTTSVVAPVLRRVNLVRQADKVIVFGDSSNDMEHVLNLAQAQNKEWLHFREV